MKTLVLGCMLMSVAHVAYAESESKTHRLSQNGLLIEISTDTASLYEQFGPRFDQTAWISSIQLAGVELLGPWGMADEFGLHGNGVLGYEEANPGEAFTKIGIGELIKDADISYSFSRRYPIDRAYASEVLRKEDSVIVIQSSPENSHWRYSYKKTYRILSDRRLQIDYELTNLSASPWSFEHYNHHWFRVDGVPVGKGYSVNTFFDLPALATDLNRGSRSLDVPAPLAPNQALYYASDLVHVGAEQHAFAWEINKQTVINYQGSGALNRFALYVDEDGFCPEAFRHWTIQPEETIQWSSVYQFFPPNLN